MRIEYNKKTLVYYILIFFVIFVECHFFNIFKLPEFLEFIIYNNRAKWIAPLGGLVSLCCWKNHSQILNPYKKFFFRFLLTLIISLAIICFYTCVAYPLNSFFTTYGFCCPYLYIFWAIPIIYIIEKEKSIHGILKLLNITCVIMLVVAILQGISYMKTGSLIFANSEDIYINVRDGKVRYSVGPFTSIMLIYNIYCLYSNIPIKSKCKILQKFFVVLWGIHSIINGQTRMVLIAEILCCCIIVIMGKTNRAKKSIFLTGILVIIMYFMFTGYLDRFISGFSETGPNGGSTIARIAAVEYYLKCFIKNPIFAISFAGDEHYYNIVHGVGNILFQTNTVWYDYSDVGIIGELAKLGIFVLPVLFWPALRMIKTTKMYYLDKDIKERSLICSMCLYIVITSLTLIITQSSRVIALPIMFAFFEYYKLNYLQNS